VSQATPDDSRATKSRLATASLVLGLLSIGCPNCLTAIPGVLSGRAALRHASRHGTIETQRTRAIVGLVTSYAGLLLCLIVSAIALFYAILMFGLDPRYLFQEVK